MHAITTSSFDYTTTFPQSSNAAKFADQVGNVQTIEAFLDKWLDRQKKHLKASTYNGYRKIVVGQLILWFGNIMRSALRKKYVWAKLEPMNATNKTMTNIQSVLRKALDDAIEDELIEVNPLARWCYSKVEAPQSKDDIDPFTKEEQAATLAHATGQARNLLQFAFWTGLRTSELVALVLDRRRLRAWRRNGDARPHPALQGGRKHEDECRPPRSQATGTRHACAAGTKGIHLGEG